jgi:hypothetical protein
MSRDKAASTTLLVARFLSPNLFQEEFENEDYLLSI